MAIRIVLAEDHQIVRQGFRALIEKDGFTVVGEASNGQEAIRMTKELRPDVALLDLAMPILNGIDAAREIQRISPTTRTILLTMHAEPYQVVEALRAGVRGYLLKTKAVTDVERAIREVHRGAVYISEGISRDTIDGYLANQDVQTDSLSARERQVLQLVAEGKTTKEIATVLGVSVKTAESHRSRLMSKLDIHETASLVRYAIRRGVVQP